MTGFDETEKKFSEVLLFEMLPAIELFTGLSASKLVYKDENINSITCYITF